MADVNTKSCDNCGVIKGEANHWWTIHANAKNKSMFITPFTLTSNDYFKTQGYNFLNACGLECLAKLESKIKEGVNPLK